MSNNETAELLHFQKIFWGLCYEHCFQELYEKKEGTFSLSRRKNHSPKDFIYESKYLQTLSEELGVPLSWREIIINLTKETFNFPNITFELLVAMQKLGKFQRSITDLYILYLHFGVDDDYRYNIQEISEILGENKELIWDKLCTMKSEIRVKRKAHAI